MKAVLITAGLDDSLERIDGPVSLWDKEIFSVHTHQFGWQDRSHSIAECKAVYIEKITTLYEQFGRVTLVGVSAGGAASIWGAEQLPHMVDRVIDACGAVRLPRLTLISKYFGSNGERFDEILEEIQGMSPKTAEKLIILRPVLYDGLVRHSSFKQFGADVRIVPVPTHIAAIGYALKHMIPTLIAPVS